MTSATVQTETQKNWIGGAWAFPGKVLTAIVALVTRAYRALKRRYGPRYTKVIVMAVFIALFVPIPGSTLLVIGVIAGVAECHRVIAMRTPPGRLGRVWTAIKRGILGKSSDAYMKQFTGSDEYWDRILAVQRDWHPKQPAKPDAPAEYEPVHGWTKRQLGDYLARNPASRSSYEAELQKHPHDAGDYEEALNKCQEGKSSEDLRQLYRMPYRERVPWGLFPSWARPTDPVEGGHEGGSI